MRCRAAGAHHQFLRVTRGSSRCVTARCIRDQLQAIVRMFSKMNWQIPVFGAILINQAMDKVLLTQTFIANNKGGAWMFPRGKVEKKDHGNSFDCACREVRPGKLSVYLRCCIACCLLQITLHTDILRTTFHGILTSVLLKYISRNRHKLLFESPVTGSCGGLLEISHAGMVGEFLNPQLVYIPGTGFAMHVIVAHRIIMCLWSGRGSWLHSSSYRNAS